ncbi:MAG TPA: hypothetical protein VMB78_08100 [Dissulfurispiraceae bacterium]|nr:hypothetical protein [Dissulfurispiraceae bacterium]
MLEYIRLLPMVEKDGRSVKDPDVRTVLFHDENPEDLSFNHTAQEKTCGICHQKELREIRQTAIGHNEKQVLYKT